MSNKITSTGKTTYVAKVTSSDQTTFVKTVKIGIPIKSVDIDAGDINALSNVDAVNAKHYNILVYDSDVSKWVNADSANLVNLTLTGNVKSKLVPSQDSSFDLGDSNLKWKDLYLSGGTIHLGGLDLKDSSTGLSVTDSIGNPVNFSLLGSRSQIRGFFGAGGDLSYDASTGIFSFDVEEVYTKANFDSDLGAALDGGTGITYDSSTDTISITNTGVTAATYGSASQVPQIAVNEQGQITSASNVAVAGVTSVAFDSASQNFTISTADGGSFVKMISNRMPNTDSGVYGTAVKIPVLTINKYGQIDSAGTVSVAGVSSTSFDSDTGLFTINTADGNSFSTHIQDSADLVRISRASLSANNVSGDGSLAYNNSTGVFSYTGPSASEVRAHLSADKGLTYNSTSGEFNIDSANVRGMFSGSNSLNYNSSTGDIRAPQPLDSSANPTFNQLRGPATFIIDPAAVGDATGTVRVLGNLTVEGTTTTINSTNVSVNDKTFTLADSAPDSAGLNGGGIIWGGSFITANKPSFTYNHAQARFDANRPISADSFIGDVIGNVTGTIQTAAQPNIDHDQLANFEANEHIDHTTVSVIAGKGLLGGGTIDANRTIDIDSSNVRGMFSGGTGVTYTSGTGEIKLTNTGVTANTYGDATSIPQIAVNEQGQITSVSTVSVAGVSSTSFDSSTGIFTINTADGNSFATHIQDSADLVKISRASLSVSNASGDGSLAYNNSTGAFTYTGPSAEEVRAHFTANKGLSLTSGEFNIDSANIQSFTVQHLGTDFVDSAEARKLISGNKGLTYNSSTGVFDVDSANIQSFTVQHLGTDFVDSGEARKLVSGDKGLTYNSSTGVFNVDSTNIQSFTVQHLGTDFVDSAEARKLISGDKGLTYNSATGVFNIDSTNIQSFTVQHLGIDFVDSAEVNILIDARDTHDSTAVQGQIDSSLDNLTSLNLLSLQVNGEIDARGGITDNSGPLILQSANGQTIQLKNHSDEIGLQYNDNGIISLRHQGNVKLLSTAYGVRITNLLDVDSADIGNLNLSTNTISGSDFISIVPGPGGNTRIHHKGNNQKLVTTDSGVLVTGQLVADSSTFTNITGTLQTAAQPNIDHDQLANFEANEHVDHTAVSVIAGKGLLGGGTIDANLTLNVDSSNIQSFTVQHLGTDFVDSAEARKLISGNKGLTYNSTTGVFDIDSANIRGFTVADAINNGTTNIAPSQNAVFDALASKLDASAVPTLGNDFVDSAEVNILIDARDTHDSAAVQGQIDSAVDADFINALTIDADTLGGQDGSHYLNYNNFTNTPTFPTLGGSFVDSSEARKVLSGSNSIDYNSSTGDIRAPQPLDSSANPTFNQLRGPATFVIDPATIGDATGTVQILGNLQVDGTTTTINSTDVTIDDKTFTLADNAADSSALNGGGIIWGGSSIVDKPSFTYNHASARFDVNRSITIADSGVLVTGQLVADSATIKIITIPGATDKIEIGNLGTFLSDAISAEFKKDQGFGVLNGGRLYVGNASGVPKLSIRYSPGLGDASIQNSEGDLDITNFANDKDIRLRADNGSGSFIDYVRLDGSTGQVKLYHYGSEKLVTTAYGATVTGTMNADSATFTNITGTLQTAAQPNIDHNQLTNFQANKHIDHTSVSVIAGKGLLGGGTIDANLTLNVDSDNIKSFTVQHLGTDFVDSAEARKLVSGNKGLTYNSSTGVFDVDSANIQSFMPKLGTDFVDSAEVNILIGALDTHDSAAVQGQIDSSLNDLASLTVTGEIDARGGITDNAGNLVLQAQSGNGIRLRNHSGNNVIQVTNAGEAKLNYTSSTKLQTTDSGVLVTGQLVADSATFTGNIRADGGELILGDEAYSVSTDYVGMKTSQMSGSQDYMILSGVTGGDANTYISAKAGSNVKIRAGGNVSTHQLQVTASGVIADGDFAFDSPNAIFFDNSERKLSFGDGRRATFGDDSDLEIYHDGSNSYIAEGGTGNLIVQTSQFQLKNGSGNENLIVATGQGAVNLYYDNVNRLQTTDSGVTVTGQLVADSATINGGSIFFDSASNSARLQLTHVLAQNSDVLRIQTSSGRMDVGPQNTGFAHFITDRPKFYFQQRILSGSNDISSYNGDYKLQRAEVTKLTLTDSGAKVTGQLVADSATISGPLTADSSTIGTISLSLSGGQALIQKNGSLNIRGNWIRLQKPNTTTDMLIAKPDGEVELYHNGNQKLETTAYGVTATGTVNADSASISGPAVIGGNGSTGGVTISDGLIDIRSGTGNVSKIKFYCEASNAHFQTLQAAPHDNASSAVLVLPDSSGTLALKSHIVDSAGVSATIIADVDQAFVNALNVDAETLDGVNSTSFLRSDAADVKTSGNLTFNDDVKAYFGTGSDLEIFHSSAINRIQATGLLYLKGTDINFYKTGTSELMASFQEDSSVSLYYDAVKKFETTDSGVLVTGQLVADSATFTNATFTGDVAFDSALAVLFDKSDKALEFGDNYKAVFGAGGDLEIYHSGGQSLIAEIGTGKLNLKSNEVEISKAGTSEKMALFTSDGAVELYYDDSKKFETTDSGATVTGLLVADSATLTNLTLSTGTSVNEFSTDTTLGGNSDNAVPTEKAVKTYVDAEVAGAGGGGVTVQDEGGALSTTATTLNFVGAGVEATGTGATKTITISGGGGGGGSFASYTSGATLAASVTALANTSSGGFTLTLPSSPSANDQIIILDAGGTFGTNNLTVGRNGNTIQGNASDLICDIDNVAIRLHYTGSDWRVYAITGTVDGNAVTLTGSQTLTNKTLTNPSINNYTEGTVAIGNTGTSHTFDITSGTFQTATLNGNCTFTMPTVATGKSFVLKLSQGGSFTAAFTSVKFAGGTAPTITTGAGKIDIISFISDGTSWYGSAIQDMS